MMRLLLQLAASSGHTGPRSLRSRSIGALVAIFAAGIHVPQAYAAQSSLQASLSSKVIGDPVNGSEHPKAIPGSTVEFEIGIANTSGNLVGPANLVIDQAVPDTLALYVGDAGPLGPGPIEFIDGPTPSGLVFVYLNLTHLTDSVEFSKDGGQTFTYQPVPDGNGLDARVTHFRVKLIGAMALKIGSAPSFSIRYRARVK